MAQAYNNGRLGEKHEWELPHLRESHQAPDTGDFWDVKFYPYIDANADPIFAVVGNTNILICRTPREKNIEILVSVFDEDPDNDNYACAWSKDLETGTPLLCFGGSSGKIKVINALTGELLRVLTGHGGGIMTLKISPVNPHILASGGEDFTVRIWSLDPAHANQPCAAILAGDGHRENILSVAFHATGRFLLSAGVDRIINLWVLPSFPDENTGTQTPTRIHYPHFSTSEVHSFIVDCVEFHNDLILSKAEREGNIVLWCISGFSSTNPPPPRLSAPTAHDPARDTRSAFSTSPLLYTRLLQFSAPDLDLMFMRFGLFPGLKTKAGERERAPVLAMCNTASKMFYWDLGRLEAYWVYISSLHPTNAKDASTSTSTSITKNPHPTPIPGPSKDKQKQKDKNKQLQPPSSPSNPPDPTLPEDQATTDAPKRPKFLIPFKPRHRGPRKHPPSLLPSHSHSRLRDPSPTESDRSLPPPSTSTSTSTTPSTLPPSQPHLEKSLAIWSKRYGIDDPTTEIQAHKEEVVKGLGFVGRQVAWSRGGEWCVVVGSVGVMAVFERWEGR